MRYKFFLLLLFTAGFLYSHAQQQWSLEKCINYALENNIIIKQQELTVELAEADLFQSKANLLRHEVSGCPCRRSNASGTHGSISGKCISLGGGYAGRKHSHGHNQ